MNEVFEFIAYDTAPGVRAVHGDGPRVAHPVTAYAVRVAAGGTLAYSGDTGLPGAGGPARDADLFLCEASFIDDAPTHRTCT